MFLRKGRGSGLCPAEGWEGAETQATHLSSCNGCKAARAGEGACSHSHKDDNGLAGSGRKPFQKATLRLPSALSPLIFLSPPVSFDKFKSTCQTCSQQLRWGTAEPPSLQVAMVSWSPGLAGMAEPWSLSTRQAGGLGPGWR